MSAKRKLEVQFIGQFRHHITGEIIRASDHGHKAFIIRRRKKK